MGTFWWRNKGRIQLLVLLAGGLFAYWVGASFWQVIVAVLIFAMVLAMLGHALLVVAAAYLTVYRWARALPEMKVKDAFKTIQGPLIFLAISIAIIAYQRYTRS